MQNVSGSDTFILTLTHPHDSRILFTLWCDPGHLGADTHGTIDALIAETDGLVESRGLGKLKRSVQKAEWLPIQVSTLCCVTPTSL